MPTLKQFRYLVALSHTLHFRHAAEQCQVTQPTLSSQIQELENDLGVQLVERSRRNQVVLTPIGKEIMERARIVLKDVQDIVDVGRHGQQWLHGTIRLGALPTLGPYLLPHVLPSLHRDYPHLKLYVREGMPAVLIDGLASAELDLLLFPLPITGADFTSVRLFREQLWVVIPAEHPLAAKHTIERTDLAGETVLALEPGHRLYEQVAEICREIDANLSHDFEGTSLDTIRLMVGMGLGLSFMPTVYVLSETPKDAQVVARPMRTQPPLRTVGLAWRRHSARSEEFQTLANAIRQVLKSGLPEVTTLE
ncbi:MAG: hydrogen peroxide-inducible genes activator [Rhizobiales bacterium]|nr:hydrogen peroxide-inducible genes activator [Hyphomicrobiales bacterium]